jgi:hypothetical protein
MSLHLQPVSQYLGVYYLWHMQEANSIYSHVTLCQNYDQGCITSSELELRKSRSLAPRGDYAYRSFLPKSMAFGRCNVPYNPSHRDTSMTRASACMGVCLMSLTTSSPMRQLHNHDNRLLLPAFLLQSCRGR